MKLRQLKITNIGCIKELCLENLDENMNVFTGSNGVGKTTILKAICSILTTSQSANVTRNSRCDKGEISGILVDGDTSEVKTQVISAFVPDTHDYTTGFDKIRKVIFISDNRELNYIKLTNIPRDINKTNFQYNQDVLNSINPGQIKGWFVNRYLFSAHPDSLSDSQIANLELSKKAFSCLDNSVTFSKVDSKSLDIILDTSFGQIYFEYLSSGFKSLIILILGIIKEIEFRLNDSNVAVSDFDGIIIIDEVEVHLHPTWQSKIASVLKGIFPKAQFFISTHSPHVVQSLPPNQLIALEKVDDNVIRRSFAINETGFIGWTIEEILRDVMGMGNTNTNYFQNLWSEFSSAVDDNDALRANELGSRLLNILHPANVLRKIIELHLTSVSND